MRRRVKFWFDQLGGAYLVIALVVSAFIFAIQLINFGD